MRNVKIAGVYVFIFLFGVFLFMSARWYSYRTPRIVETSYEEVIEKSDPILAMFKNKPKEGMYYFKIVRVTSVDSAGTFPFLADTKFDTAVTIWSRPTWTEYK